MRLKIWKYNIFIRSELQIEQICLRNFEWKSSLFLASQSQLILNILLDSQLYKLNKINQLNRENYM